MTKGFAQQAHDFGLELIEDSELLKDSGERHDQVCSVGRSVQKTGMDSNRDRLEERVSFLHSRGDL